ncbi:hypothetical protein SAMN05444392_101731 [Seinonella peptonophila]|uniref:Uncharacterized protein n=1 Tax=Seinonella peptonophila TaxID=112248 RepID=A0A1M4TZN4_9BACL|nr:hypothetical protein SAMN05444392_101731 [Seinonella peptonophila]
MICLQIRLYVQLFTIRKIPSKNADQYYGRRLQTTLENERCFVWLDNYCDF